jgi:hypothetical protein
MERTFTAQYQRSSGAAHGAPLYKYMEARWARRFLAHGELRIGTLYGFRDIERLGSEIGDESEGFKHLRQERFTTIDTRRPETVPYFLRDRITVRSPDRLQIVAERGVGGTQEDPNCLVFCLTDLVDRGTMKRMGYDTCVEVLAPQEFFRALTMKLSHVASSFWGAARVVYRSRTVQVEEDFGIPPAFIKDPQYENQHEVRGVWVPKRTDAIVPVIVRAKKAAKVCRAYTAI